MATTVQYPKLVDIKLRTPGTAPGQQQQHNGDGSTATEMQRLRPQTTTGPMPLRYFAVGRSTERVVCPMCREETDTNEQTKGNICDTINGWLCCLSCCFPIFALSCCYLCIRGACATPRTFCSKCGGYLGFQSRPK